MLDVLRRGFLALRNHQTRQRLSQSEGSPKGSFAESRVYLVGNHLQCKVGPCGSCDFLLYPRVTMGGRGALASRYLRGFQSRLRA